MDVRDMLRLDGRVAIVTGGRGLYGAGISEGLAEMGATVVIASRDGAKCDEYAATVRERGLSAVGMELDLSSDKSIDGLISAIMEKYGRIDVLVNNAVTRDGMADMTVVTREQLALSEDININGQIILTQRVLPVMQKQGKGNIIIISSMRGIDAPHFPFYGDLNKTVVNYTTEKWAQVGLTKLLAAQFGKDGIRTNCICPGGYDPSLVGHPFHETYKQHNPLGRWAEQYDIKGPVVFLASDASAYVNGLTLVMDGGWTIW